MYIHPNVSLVEMKNYLEHPAVQFVEVCHWKFHASLPTSFSSCLSCWPSLLHQYGSVLIFRHLTLHLVLHVHVQRKIVDGAIGGEGLFVGEDCHRLVEVVLGKPEGSLDLGHVGEAHAEQGVDVLIVSLHLAALTPPPPLSRSATSKFKDLLLQDLIREICFCQHTYCVQLRICDRNTSGEKCKRQKNSIFPLRWQLVRPNQSNLKHLSKPQTF